MGLNKYKLHEEHARDGVWFSFLAGSELKMRLAYAGPTNKRFQRMRQEALRPYRGIPIEEIPDEEFVEAMAPVAAKALILEWEGARWNDDDPELESTTENKVQVLTSIPGLLSDVIRKAANIDAFRQWEEAKGNS